MENSELQQNTEKIRTLLSSAKSDLAELREIKDQATNIRSTLRGRNTESESRLKVITQLNVSASQLEEQIRTSVSAVSLVVSEIQKYKVGFDKLESNINDEDTGIGALFEEVKGYRDDVEVLKKEADGLVVDIKTRFNEVEQIKIQATEGRDHIQTLAADSESLKESIRENLELVTDSVLQNAFREREKALFGFVRAWLVLAVVSIVGLAVGVMYMFNKLSMNGFDGWRDWYRLLFLTPLVFLVGWSTRSYGQERRLHEKYAYKAVISTSLTSYIKLLTDKFEESQDEVLVFTKEILAKIFKEPYEDHSAKIRGNFSLWNVFKADIELDEKTKESIILQAQKRTVDTNESTTLEK